jgi:hypothetical protein
MWTHYISLYFQDLGSVAEITTGGAILMPRLWIATRIFAAAADVHVTAFCASQGLPDDACARLMGYRPVLRWDVLSISRASVAFILHVIYISF